MNTMYLKIPQQLIIVCCLASSLVGFPAHAATISPAQSPLYVGITAAKPNIMLMIDTSGSMSSNVDVASTITSPSGMPGNASYNCPTANIIAGGVTPPATPSSTVYMTVSGTGTVRVCTSTSSCSSNNRANFGDQLNGKCFDNTKNYNVAYYGGAALAGGPYSGLQLNWYFANGSFASGSLTGQGTISSTRIAIATQAAADLVAALTPASGASPTVRMGLSTYYYPSGSSTGDGGELLTALADLDANQSTTITNQINAMSANGNTPLATTLSDIGKYYAMGETGNLTLHPAGSSSTASVNTIFSKSNGTTTHSITNSTGTTLTNPILGYCQQSFVILISDGLPNGDREISPSLRDYTGDCAKAVTPKLCDSTPNSLSLPGANSGTPLSATGTGCHGASQHPTVAADWYYLACQNGTKAGRIYETKGSDYLDDVAEALYEMDLRPSLDAASKTNGKYKNNVVTYAIGLADPSLQTHGILNDAAALGGGKFYFASDAKALAAALDDVIGDISAHVGSSSSVAANSSKLENTSVIYQAKFDSSNWIGSFLAYPITASEDVNGNGVLDPGEDLNGNGKLDAGSVGSLAWNAASLIPAFGSRNIATYNTTTGLGSTFTCAGLSASQKTTLGIGNDCTSTTDQGIWRLNYLRGDWSHEEKNLKNTITEIRTGTNLIFRNRTHLDDLTKQTTLPDPWVLGDIVNSDPVFVSAEDYGYSKLPSTEGSSYSAFVTANKERRKMVYVGANDGMLHGFDGTTGTTDGGKEILAYVPNAVYSQLYNLSDPNYNHAYSVDGSPRVDDAYFGGAWHTVLLGTTGAGGKAIFALDITNPDSFGSSKVLWEISDAYSPTASNRTTDTTATRGFGNNLGFTIPQPSLVRMYDGSWAAIVANGYGSVNNLAVLYIINAQTGALIRAIDTMAGSSSSPNGLSTPIVIDTDNDGIADAIYAGDLQGNMWKFDVKSATPANWGVAYGTTGAPSPLFVACSDTANCSTTRQPITGKPQVGDVGASQTGGVMVYFGTGKYIETSDNTVTGAQTQTFYGIWDNAATVARSNLQSQSILLQTSSGGFNLRVSSDNSVNYPTQKGWYMDLITPAIPADNTVSPPIAAVAASNLGERVVSAPLLRNGRIVFETLIPIPPVGTAVCGAGSDGTSWLMELDAVTGKRLPGTAAGAPWDITNDGMINASDLLTVSIGGQSVTVSPSGKQSTVGLVDTPGVVTNGQLEYKYTSGSKQGQLEVTVEQGAGSTSSTGARQSWRQILQ